MGGRFFLMAGGLCVALGCGAQSVRAEAGAEAGGCFALSDAMAAGAYLTTGQVREVGCVGQQPLLPLAYDHAARAPFATQAMAGGTYLGRILLEDGAIAAAGEMLRLRVSSGPVIVEREVRPLRAVRDGDRAMLRTGNGTVIEARFVAAEASR